jgi:hypothetical protein
MIATQAEKKIREDAEAYMNGNIGLTPNDITIEDLIRSGEFVEVAPNLNNQIHEVVKKWFTAVAIDGLWYVLTPSVSPFRILVHGPGLAGTFSRRHSTNPVCLSRQQVLTSTGLPSQSIS